MKSADSWDNRLRRGGERREWTVMGQLRDRQRRLRSEAQAAQARVARRTEGMRLMTAASGAADYEDSIRARWRGGPTVLAFLFSQPDSEAIRALDASGEYFDHRSGDTWDLFFPGYHRGVDASLGRAPSATPVGSKFTGDWFFDPRDFDHLRRHVQERSEDRWSYSGLTDLVLICGWLPETGEPTIDWASTISGSVGDSGDAQTLTLNEVIERISEDLESGEEDENFGVAAVVNPSAPSTPGTAGRDVLVGALGGIAAALGKSALDI